ncbi:hypothetical protein H6F98_11090 [Microcoleus sp. FACHB-SPT15]|uniref:hypothetical protein n=1 Tax=Microcoleus sp. FACHB-SPT15 TaxID=2692830 RepID=UPI00177CD0EB|nr:hypothetical protein [Microcoleus sp. FACHB-SPT15]MBD1805995.1 hypothetical protein [Microcoleus sp. FACHB-SPT15]
MTQCPDDEKQWQEFLRQHRSTPPPAKADLEEQLMNAVEKSQSPVSRQLWAVPPVIAASLLMAWSGYRTLIPFPELSNSASLEAFLENNWEGVVGETSTYSQSNNTQTDWMVYAKTAP